MENLVKKTLFLNKILNFWRNFSNIYLLSNINVEKSTKFIKICQNLLKIAKICPNFGNFVRNCHNLSKIPKIFKNLLCLKLIPFWYIYIYISILHKFVKKEIYLKLIACPFVKIAKICQKYPNSSKIYSVSS